MYGTESHAQFLNHVYAKFAQSNPLHPNAFPSVLHMEKDVVRMTAAMLGSAGGADVHGASLGRS